MALAAAVLFVVALMATISGGRGNQAQTLATDLDSPVIFDGFPELTSLDTADTASPRPVFRHSVIPGGVYTPAELKNALVRDAVVASHYPSLKPEAVRAAVVTQDRFAYVSYRKDDQIYWTRNKVRLSAGETILTDGANEIRARCGNCISDTAMLPVADVEPDAAELDRLVDEGDYAGDPLLAAAVRSALESPGSNQSMLGGPAGSDPGGVVSSSGPTGSLASSIPGGPSGRIGPTGFFGSGPSSSGGSPSVGGGPPGFAGQAPGGPGPSGGAPGDPKSGGPDGPFGPPGTAPPGTLPPGINPPPGFDPTSGHNPPSGDHPPGFNSPPGLNPQTGPNQGPPGPEQGPPAPGSEEKTGNPSEAASVPEPGTMFLLGGGAAVALLRKLRRQRQR